MNTIETTGLTKVYSSSMGRRRVQALLDLHLSVPQGTIFGLLGPNGAGKTTLVKLLLGITFPTVGSAKILGENINNYKVKKRIGYLPENHKYPPYLTGGEVLNFFGKLSGLEGKSLEKKIDELLDMMKLLKWKKTKVKNYSKGMMQRLGLAQAMLNEPELIFLDEPTDGVDPIGRKEIRDILLDLKAQSKTIFLNSHLLSEVELITDRVGILNKGKLLQEGTVQELTDKEEYLINIDEESGSLPDNINTSILMKLNKGKYSLKVNDIVELNKIIDQMRGGGVMINEIIKHKDTLEDMFINLITESEKENQA
ncbi:MAG TPA: ABC transporter ATP-binding protein [Ignavibacteriaceae bacterium]|nr:ABC transporter ATP-binding protein [Ignavibacteriaceae bacterium]